MTNQSSLSLAPARWVESNVSEEKEEIFLPSPCGYTVISPTWPELFHLRGLCPSIAPFCLPQTVLHEKLKFIPLLHTRGTCWQPSFVEGSDSLPVPPGFNPPGCNVPCAERDPTLCWAMTAARGTIKEIGGDDKAAGLDDLQGSFTNTATDQGACSTSNWLTSPVAFKAERL